MALSTVHKISAAAFVLLFAFWSLSAAIWIVILINAAAKAFPLNEQKFVAGVKRKMSNVTGHLARGGWPPESRIPPAVIHIITHFQKPPSLQTLRKLVAERLLSQVEFDVLRRVPVLENSTSFWSDPLPAERIDLAEHIKEELHEDEDSQNARIEELMQERLPSDRPLWQVVILRSKTVAAGRSSIVLRISHTIGDGISLVKVFTAVFSDKNGNEIGVPEFLRRPPRKAPAASGTEKVLQYVDLARRSLLALIKVILVPIGPEDDATALRHALPYKYTDRRKMILCPGIEFERIKTVKAHFDATINDVVTSCLVGALRRYMDSVNDPKLARPSALQVRALLPYAFPRDFAPGKPALRNNFVFVSLSLPVDKSDAVARLIATKQNCDKMKASPEAHLQNVLTNIVASLLPHEVGSKTAMDIFSKHTCVFTNVPGPQEKIYLAGEPMEAVYCCLANIIAQVSALSYDGKLFLSFVIDDDVVKDSQKLGTLFDEELNELYSIAKRAVGGKKA